MQYPARILIRTPGRLANWRPLAQWILAIPHLLIASALASVSGALWIVTWFVILFTGRLPASLANFQVMILRYTARAELYAGFLHDQFPPFDFSLQPDDPGGSPVVIDVVPQLDDRNRLTVGLRFIWAIPAVVYAFVIAVVGIVCWVAAFFAILFTGRWPHPLYAWAMRMQRTSIRLSAYVLLLTDEYPPFESD